MVKRIPLSPPPSNDERLQYRLHYLAQNDAQYSNENNQHLEDGNQIHSGQRSAYSSPGLTSRPVIQRQLPRHHSAYLEDLQMYKERIVTTRPDYPYIEYHNNLCQGMPNGDHSLSYQHFDQPQNIPYTPAPSSHHDYLPNGVQFETPLTPMSTDHNSDVRRTRSGRRIGEPISGQSSKNLSRKSDNETKPAKSRSSKQAKGDRSKIPKLTAPLSELTEGYSHVPVKNMEEWVNRPVEVRRREVEDRKGYVTRPMNSFMLYRSAYADRTKLWCLQNNHQVVSTVSGESWPLESEEIREKYNEYAKIERNNHQIAHPGYKFSPSKAQNPRKRRISEEEESELSDLDDFDTEYGTTRKSKGRQRSSKKQGKEAGYPAYSAYIHRSQEPVGGPNVSSYEFTNPGKPLPAPIDGNDLYNQYYQTSIYPHSTNPNISDVKMKPTNRPEFSSSSSLIGLPGGYHPDLFQNSPYSDMNMSMSMEEGKVDPLLLALDDTQLHDGSPLGGSLGGADIRPRDDTPSSVMDEYPSVDNINAQLANYRQPHAYQSGAHLFPDHKNHWHSDLEHGSEFDKWVE